MVLGNMTTRKSGEHISIELLHNTVSQGQQNEKALKRVPDSLDSLPDQDYALALVWRDLSVKTVAGKVSIVSIVNMTFPIIPTGYVFTQLTFVGLLLQCYRYS